MYDCFAQVLPECNGIYTTLQLHVNTTLIRIVKNFTEVQKFEIHLS